MISPKCFCPGLALKSSTTPLGVSFIGASASEATRTVARRESYHEKCTFCAIGGCNWLSVAEFFLSPLKVLHPMPVPQDPGVSMGRRGHF